MVRVITPGTATDFHLLEPKENNFLVAVTRAAGGLPIGLAYVDASTGAFQATEFADATAEEKLRDELQLLRPREILLPRQSGLFQHGGTSRPEGTAGNPRDGVETRLEEWIFRTSYGERMSANSSASKAWKAFRPG